MKLTIKNLKRKLDRTKVSRDSFCGRLSPVNVKTEFP